MYRKIIFYVCLITLLSAYQVKSAVYYIDNENGNDNNDGLSVISPWKTISKVNSASYEPGDKILFKRDGKWYETLEVSSSGTAENPVTYSAYGEGSLPLIDVLFSAASCIIAHTKEHIIISNFSLLNNYGNGTVRIMYGLNVSVENNTIRTTGKGGIFIENSSNCKLADNTITTPSGEYDQETDGIYSQRNFYNTYERNKIIISNSHPVYHIDAVQSYLDEGLTIKNNHIIQQNFKNSSQGIYSTFGSGLHYYYNNIVDCYNSVSSVVGFSTPAENTELQLVHNTLIGKGANIMHISGSPVYTIKNNIFKAQSSNYSVVNIENINETLLQMDYNLFYNGGNPHIIVLDGTKLTMGEWKAKGYDKNSVESDPMLETDYTLHPLSPAIDAGTDLGLFYQYDKGGILRPQLTDVDLGAYEYISELEETDSLFSYNYELFQNYPNPFNPTTIIKFSIAEPADITLKIFDILGNEVQTLINRYTPAGEYGYEFNAAGLASGVYIYRLEYKRYIQSRKMIILK